MRFLPRLPQYLRGGKVPTIREQPQVLKSLKSLKSLGRMPRCRPRLRARRSRSSSTSTDRLARVLDVDGREVHSATKGEGTG